MQISAINDGKNLGVSRAAEDVPCSKEDIFADPEDIFRLTGDVFGAAGHVFLPATSTSMLPENYNPIRVGSVLIIVYPPDICGFGKILPVDHYGFAIETNCDA
jgi:hypothetical protein